MLFRHSSKSIKCWLVSFTPAAANNTSNTINKYHCIMYYQWKYPPVSIRTDVASAGPQIKHGYIQRYSYLSLSHTHTLNSKVIHLVGHIYCFTWIIKIDFDFLLILSDILRFYSHNIVNWFCRFYYFILDFILSNQLNEFYTFQM